MDESKGKAKANFENEADLCAQFIKALPEGWTAYAETGGFDIMLVRSADGAQIGVEAKMTLNAKVLIQAIGGIYSGHGRDTYGPDFRAVLVPRGSSGKELSEIARMMGLCVIELQDGKARDKHIDHVIARYEDCGSKLDPKYIRRRAEESANLEFPKFTPSLPQIGDYGWRSVWTDFCPYRRCKVPDYVPDVVAGASGPTKLSEWKIKAIKICILLERRGWLSVSDFKTIGIDRKRWLDMHWIQGGDTRGKYIAGSRPLDLRIQHPTNFEQIAADFEKWAPKAIEFAAQGELM